MHVKDKELATYHWAPMLHLATVGSPGPHDNSSHYRDSHLCIMASDPNEKRTRVRTPIRLSHLLLYIVFAPIGASWALSGPHPRALYEAEVSGSSQRRESTTLYHMHSHGSLTSCIVRIFISTTTTSSGPTHSMSH